MTQYDKIPALLDQAMTCSMAEAARRVGISHSLPWSWSVQSRLGHPELQEITWCGVTAPYHVQLDNLKLLSVQAIEQSAVERALNGCYVDVFFQGQRQYEDVLKPEFEGKDEDTLALEIGPDYKSVCYERVPAKQWLKPSDALVIKVLESWKRKRYGAHQQIDVNYGGVLRLSKDAKPEAAAVEATAVEVFDGERDDAAEQRGGQLALAAPAKTSDEFEARAAAGEFAPAPVAFRNASGETAALRPDIEALRKQAEELRRNGPKHRQPSHHVEIFNADDRPDKAVMSQDGEYLGEPWKPPQRAASPDAGLPQPVTPRDVEAVGTGREGVGVGPDPEMLGRHRGFRVV